MNNANQVALFNKALRSSADDRKSGNLHVFSRLQGSLKNAVLVFKSGELIGCSFVGKVGSDAIRALLRGVIVKSTFIPRDNSQFVAQQGLPSIRDILHELHTLQTAEQQKQQSGKRPSPKLSTRSLAVKNQMVDTLAQVIGDDQAKQQTQEIAKRISPDTQTEQFVEACMDLAASYVGEHTARILFSE